MQDGARQIEEGADACAHADVLELAHVDELQRIAGLRDKARFESARRADEADLCAVLVAEFVGDGEGGDDVAARAPAGDEDFQDWPSR